MLTLAQTEAIVKKHDNLFWDGWNVIFVNPKIDGYAKVAGIYYDNRWSVKRVIQPNEKGLYALPQRYTTKSS